MIKRESAEGIRRDPSKTRECEHCTLAGKIQAACGCCAHTLYFHAFEQETLRLCKAKFFPDFDETCFTPWRGWERCFTDCPAALEVDGD